jgi:hypothetical protein
MPALRVLGAALLLAAPFSAGADDWPGPVTKEVFSASREHFVRVVPGESLGDTYGFIGAKKGKFATAELYRRAEDRSYRLVAEVALLNPVAPVELFVANDGRFATVDNWHNVGYGKVVSIYDARGQIIRSYELKDLFRDDEIKAFQRSASSIYWRNGPMYIREDQTTLLLTVRGGADFLFGMETGQYKYCEAYEKTFRCRNTNQLRAWGPNIKFELTK